MCVGEQKGEWQEMSRTGNLEPMGRARGAVPRRVAPNRVSSARYKRGHSQPSRHLQMESGIPGHPSQANLRLFS